MRNDKIDINAADIARINRIAKTGARWKEICDSMGISVDTMRRRRAENPEIEAAYNEGRSSGTIKLLDIQFQNALGGDKDDIKAQLSRRGYPEKEVISIEDQRVDNETLEEKIARLRELEKRYRDKLDRIAPLVN